MQAIVSLWPTWARCESWPLICRSVCSIGNSEARKVERDKTRNFEDGRAARATEFNYPLDELPRESTNEHSEHVDVSRIAMIAYHSHYMSGNLQWTKDLGHRIHVLKLEVEDRGCVQELFFLVSTWKSWPPRIFWAGRQKKGTCCLWQAAKLPSKLVAFVDDKEKASIVWLQLTISIYWVDFILLSICLPPMRSIPAIADLSRPAGMKSNSTQIPIYWVFYI